MHVAFNHPEQEPYGINAFLEKTVGNWCPAVEDDSGRLAIADAL
jgi:hypothetical protein